MSSIILKSFICYSEFYGTSVIGGNGISPFFTYYIEVRNFFKMSTQLNLIIQHLYNTKLFNQCQVLF